MMRNIESSVCPGSPLDLVQPETLRWKVAEPLLLLGKQRFANVDIRVRVKGGGHVSQIYGALLQLAVDPGQSDTGDCRHSTPGQAESGTVIRNLCARGAAAIRQAIAKSLVAFYQKCESLI